MLNPGTIILFSPRYDGRQPAPRIACCRRADTIHQVTFQAYIPQFGGGPWLMCC